MGVAATRPGREYSEPKGIVRLWAVLLAGPLSWAAGLGLDYSLVIVACESGSNAWLHLVSLITLVVASTGAWIAHREWRRLGGGVPGERVGRVERSRFMAALGVMTGVFFSLVIIAQWIASFVLHPCMGI